MKHSILRTPIFLKHVVQRFLADRCLQRASALAYATLLAIVPLVILAFAIFTSFQGADVLAARMQGYLVGYLVPTGQQAVLSYLSSLSEKAHSLSAFSAVGLLITIVALFTTMDESINDIWRIQKKRSYWVRFMTFWSLLTLSPILLGVSISITSYFAALPLIHDATNQVPFMQHIPFMIPWIISSLAMTAMYLALPHQTLPIRPALWAGMVAGALFEGSKIAFTYYVTQLAHYEQLYGALGALPVFLIWIYVTWVIVLFGAEFHVSLHRLTHPADDRPED